MSDCGGEPYPAHSPGHHHPQSASHDGVPVLGLINNQTHNGMGRDHSSAPMPAGFLPPEHTGDFQSIPQALSQNNNSNTFHQNPAISSPVSMDGEASKLPPSPLVTPPGGGGHNNNRDYHVGTCASLTDLAKAAQVSEASSAAPSSANTNNSNSSNKTKRAPVPHVYHDYGAVPVQPNILDTRKKTGGVTVPFPEKLHEMLDAETGSIVGWLPHGRAFCVRKPKDFTSQVMPKYFRQTKLTSFQRQLNLYGFRRITQGADAGAYYHELFLRGRPTLSHRMIRQKVKGTGHKQPADASSEPNLYLYPPVQPETTNAAPQSNESSFIPYSSLNNNHHHQSGFTAATNHGGPNTIDASPGLHGAAHLLHGIAVDMRQQAQSLPPPFLGRPSAPGNGDSEGNTANHGSYTQRQARQSSINTATLQPQNMGFLRNEQV